MVTYQYIHKHNPQRSITVIDPSRITEDYWRLASINDGNKVILIPEKKNKTRTEIIMKYRKFVADDKESIKRLKGE